MSGRGDARVSAALVHALGRGPLDVVAIAESLREAEPAVFRGSEGGLHGLLLERLRAGRLHAVGRGARGIPLYSVAPGSDGSPKATAPPPAVSPSVSRRAVRVASGVRDPSERGRVASEVLAHLADLERRGLSGSFGSAKSARHLLRRADRRRGAVYFTAEAWDHAKRALINDGPWVLGAIVAYFLVKWFVLEVFVIPSESMYPTMQVGDRVAVWRLGGASVPERWSIVTFELGGTTYVKRAAGLPNERFAIKHGDLYADGVLLQKPEDLRRALRSRWTSWDLSTGPPAGWDVREEGGLVRWGPSPETSFYSDGTASQRLAESRRIELRDVYLDLSAERSGGGELSLVLRREGIVPSQPGVEWTLEVGHATVALRERSTEPGAAPATIAEVPRRSRDTDLVLSLSYVDGVLSASADGLSWSAWRTAPRGRARFAVLFRGRTARGLRLDLDQDLHYSNDGSNGTMHADGAFDPSRRPAGVDFEIALKDPPVEDFAFPIPLGHVFVLGDNTTNSNDSRFNLPGAVPVDSLVGPVVFRVWPVSRIGRVR